MSDTDDPTKKYPPPDDYKTNPMLETILHEVREGFANVNQRLDRVEQRLDHVEKELADFRAETRTELKRVGRKFDTIAGDVYENRAEIRELEDRVEALETPPRT